MKFNFLASLCSLGDWFETHFVGHTEDRFSRDEARILCEMLYKLVGPQCQKTCLWGFQKKQNLNQSPQIKRLARKLKFRF